MTKSPSSFEARTISSLAFFISSGSLGKLAGESTSNPGIGAPLSLRYFSSFSVSLVMMAANSTMLVVEGLAISFAFDSTGTAPLTLETFSSLVVSISASFVAGTAMVLDLLLCLLLSTVPFEELLNGRLQDPRLNLLPATRNLGILNSLKSALLGCFVGDCVCWAHDVL